MMLGDASLEDFGDGTLVTLADGTQRLVPVRMDDRAPVVILAMARSKA